MRAQNQFFVFVDAVVADVSLDIVELRKVKVLGTNSEVRSLVNEDF